MMFQFPLSYLARNLGLFLACLVGSNALGELHASTLAETRQSEIVQQDEGKSDNQNQSQEQEQEQDVEEAEESVSAPAKVDVDPLAKDDQIEARLQRILLATRWFIEPKVNVEEGVVFLSGMAKRDEHRQWAGDLGRNTQDVVAVVNRITVAPQPFWDLRPATREIEALGRNTVNSLPMLSVALLVLLVSWGISGIAMRLSRYAFELRYQNRLLSVVLARTTAIIIFLLGVYLALRITGLTQIAVTLLGGTGLIGLVVGIAFRDIAENFLASLLISIQRPFALGDRIQVNGHEGFVQSVTFRGTQLMTLDGNHVQIPNSAVYKSTISNLTANPNQRLQFDVKIGFEDSISTAQDLILDVLKDHAAVLATPEPLVLAESYDHSQVNLRVLFWIDSIKHEPAKVRSALIRLSKRAIQHTNLKIAGEPAKSSPIPADPSLPQSMLGDTLSPTPNRRTEPSVSGPLPQTLGAIETESSETSTKAEGELENEADMIQQQSAICRSPEQGTNLLEVDDPPHKSLSF